MKKRNRPFFQKASFRSLVLLLMILVLFASMSFVPAAAQFSTEAWTPPVNLSHSGAASNPIMVVDSNGIYHVIWQDAFSGYVYTSGDGEQWSPPVPVNFPWSRPAVLRQRDTESTPEIVPWLFADAQGSVHALWMNEENILYYSRVLTRNFASPGAWLSRQRLAENALDLDAALDASGNLHLAYVRAKESNDFPAGVYYSILTAKSNYWAPPRLIYESPYFRTLTVETAHVRVDTASTAEGQNNVYVAWDNPTRERVFFTRSADNGNTWEPPLEIDQPAEGATIGGPSRILISATGANVFLLWQADHSGTSCSQFYQSSQDGGTTWQERQRKPEDFLDCPERSELMEIDENSILLFSAISERVYLQAWDGRKWSDPQAQEILTNFNDQETNRLVSLSCQQPVLLPGGNLLVVGCDTGGGQDIWWMKRQLVDVEDWYPKEAVWNSMVSVASGQVNFLTPVLVAENGERVHAFWSQPSDTAPDGPGTSIFYARWEGRQWSQPIAVLSSPSGKAEQPSAAMDPFGRIFLVWSGGSSGEVYFSQVSSSQAVLSSAWSAPQLLPSAVLAGSSPDILVDSQGRIFVAYSIPLNEGRGIYLTHSDDQGESWSDPVRVFDGVAADWAMVDRPRLALSRENNLHLIWTRFSLPNGTGPLGLYYAQSQDRGVSWSVPAAVVDKPVVWSEIVGFEQGTIHRIWQELSSGRATLWHEASTNDGVTWTRTAPVSIFGDTVGSPAITGDRASQLHLLQIISRGATSFVMQHWLWNGSTWSTERNLDLGLAPATNIGALASSTSPDGHLSVVFAGRSVNRDSGLPETNLFFADRSYQLPEVPPTPLPVDATPTAAPVITETPAQLPTATDASLLTPSPAAPESLPQEPVDTGNAWVGSVLVPVAAGLIVLVAILIGIKMRQP